MVSTGHPNGQAGKRVWVGELTLSFVKYGSTIRRIKIQRKRKKEEEINLPTLGQSFV